MLQRFFLKGYLKISSGGLSIHTSLASGILWGKVTSSCRAWFSLRKLAFPEGVGEPSGFMELRETEGISAGNNTPLL